MSMTSSAKVETPLFLLTDKAPRQASRAWMKRRDWIGGGRLTWGLILRGIPVGGWRRAG